MSLSAIAERQSAPPTTSNTSALTSESSVPNLAEFRAGVGAEGVAEDPDQPATAAEVSSKIPKDAGQQEKTPPATPGQDFQRRVANLRQFVEDANRAARDAGTAVKSELNNATDLALPKMWALHAAATGFGGVDSPAMVSIYKAYGVEAREDAALPSMLRFVNLVFPDGAGHLKARRTKISEALGLAVEHKIGPTEQNWIKFVAEFKGGYGGAAKKWRERHGRELRAKAEDAQRNALLDREERLKAAEPEARLILLEGDRDPFSDEQYRDGFATLRVRLTTRRQIDLLKIDTSFSLGETKDAILPIGAR